MCDLLSKSFDIDHALFLCQIHRFPEGTLLLHERLGLYAEVLHVHMTANDHRNVIETCKRVNKEELWTLVSDGGGKPGHADSFGTLSLSPFGRRCNISPQPPATAPT